MRMSVLLLALCITLGAGRVFAGSTGCNQPTPGPVAKLRLPGQPFSAIPTADGCTIFVSLTPTSSAEKSQLAVIGRRAGKLSLIRTLPGADQLIGMALSPDGRVLAASDDHGVILFDTPSLITGPTGIVLARADDGPGSGAAYVAFSPDGRLLAVSDEQSRTITIYNFRAFTRGQPITAIGKVPLDYGPSGLTFSPDGKRLYVAVQVAASPGTECQENGARNGPHAAGELVVIGAERVAVTPESAVMTTVPAGCNPVRVALSPSGDRAYVTMRASNAVGAFDTTRLVSDPGHASVGLFRVGKSPVGVVATGKLVFVTNSDRFGGGHDQTISVIDPHDPSRIRSIPAAGFPCELNVTSDGKTLLVTNFTSEELELVDLEKL